MAKFTSKTGTPTMVKYAAKELGIDLSGLEREEVIVRLNEAEPGVYDNGNAPDGGGSGTEPQGGGSGTEPQAKGDASVLGGGSGTEPKKKVMTRATITIPSSENQFKENFVQIGLNGVMHQIMKDTDVTVSAGVVEVLENAVEINYIQETDPITKMNVLKEVKTRRWPFQIIERHYD